MCPCRTAHVVGMRHKTRDECSDLCDIVHDFSQRSRYRDERPIKHTINFESRTEQKERTLTVSTICKRTLSVASRFGMFILVVAALFQVEVLPVMHSQWLD